MRRTWHIWAVFSVFLAVVLAAMGWVSLAALRMEKSEADARWQAGLQEKIRLSLWRMDSALAPLIAQESSRPYFSYVAFHPVDRAYTRMFEEIRPQDVLVPSELLTYRSDWTTLHFQLAPDGQLTSPQVPTGNQRDLAESGFVSHEDVEKADTELQKLKPFLEGAKLLAMLPPEPPPTATAVAFPATVRVNEPPLAQIQHPRQSANTPADQQALNQSEWQRRFGAVQNANSPVGQYRNTFFDAGVSKGPLRGIWLGRGTLVLAQRVNVGGKVYVQGCVLNWPAIFDRLRDEIQDLLPGARLLPMYDEFRDVGDEYTVAALPIRLAHLEIPPSRSQVDWPIRLSLIVAWACVLLGAGAVALVLAGAISLSQRRGTFVSAVTHEMRTPLTTFRLYTDLLAGGMVSDEAKQKAYLQKLSEESQRLSHLVENVLAYARLSGARTAGEAQAVTLEELAQRTTQRLAARVEQAGMKLVVEGPPDAAQTCVKVNVSVVEQILTNLIDNACKYAGSAAQTVRGGAPVSPREVAQTSNGLAVGQEPHRADVAAEQPGEGRNTIHIEMGVRDGLGILRIRDHGPGIGKAQLKSLFKPFHRSAHQAAGSSPGVGLGLALSRRLARDMGGDLRLESAGPDGAWFDLEIPLEDRQ